MFKISLHVIWTSIELYAPDMSVIKYVNNTILLLALSFPFKRI